MSLSICALLKLAVLPAVVWGLAVALQGPIASALIITSILSAFTTPIVMMIMASIG